MVLLADQHRKRSCLAGASTCFWTQCTEYLQQVTQSAVSAGTWYRRLYFSTVLGKHLLVKTGTCRSGGASDSGDSTLLAPSKFLALALSLLFIVCALSSPVDICCQTIGNAIRCRDGTWSGSNTVSFYLENEYLLLMS